MMHKRCKLFLRNDKMHLGNGYGPRTTNCYMGRLRLLVICYMLDFIVPQLGKEEEEEEEEEKDSIS
jgi:hypothetical protein